MCMWGGGDFWACQVVATWNKSTTGLLNWSLFPISFPDMVHDKSHFTKCTRITSPLLPVCCLVHVYVCEPTASTPSTSMHYKPHKLLRFTHSCFLPPTSCQPHTTTVTTYQCPILGLHQINIPSYVCVWIQDYSHKINQGSEESVSLPCSQAAAYFDLCLIFLLLRFNLRTWKGGDRRRRGGEGEGRETHGLNTLITEISRP